MCTRNQSNLMLSLSCIGCTGFCYKSHHTIDRWWNSYLDLGNSSTNLLLSCTTHPESVHSPPSNHLEWSCSRSELLLLLFRQLFFQPLQNEILFITTKNYQYQQFMWIMLISITKKTSNILYRLSEWLGVLSLHCIWIVNSLHLCELAHHFVFIIGLSLLYIIFIQEKERWDCLRHPKREQ